MMYSGAEESKGLQCLRGHQAPELCRGRVGHGALRLEEPRSARWHHGDGGFGGQRPILGRAAGHPNSRVPGMLTAALPQGHHTQQPQPACPASATDVLDAGWRAWLPKRRPPRSRRTDSFKPARQLTACLGLQVHAADILAMAASPAGDAVFAAGIDPQLALYKRVPGTKGQLRRFRPPPRCMLGP